MINLYFGGIVNFDLTGLPISMEFDLKWIVICTNTRLPLAETAASKVKSMSMIENTSYITLSNP